MDGTLDGEMFRRRMGLVMAALALLASEASARPRQSDAIDTLLETVRQHRRTLEEDVPRRERDLHAALASLDRRSVLYAQGLMSREELQVAAREVSDARGRLEATRSELLRTAALITEIEARRRLARLPSLRPGQYEVHDAFVRYAGTRPFAPAAMRALARHFVERLGRTLPVSAVGQTDVHTRLGLDHRDAIDVAVHPDSAEGRLVIAWLRAHDISFLAFRGAQTGMATGAHIHVGPPSERIKTGASASRVR